MNDPHSPDWSPDGSKLAYANWTPSVGGGVYTERADGTDEQKIATDAQEPAWSPDGTKIAYLYGGKIYVANADGSGAKALVQGMEPSWQPTTVHMVTCLIPKPLSP